MEIGLESIYLRNIKVAKIEFLACRVSYVEPFISRGHVGPFIPNYYTTTPTTTPITLVPHGTKKWRENW